jgi:hypothetical protein
MLLVQLSGIYVHLIDQKKKVEASLTGFNLAFSPASKKIQCLIFLSA